MTKEKNERGKKKSRFHRELYFYFKRHKKTGHSATKKIMGFPMVFFDPDLEINFLKNWPVYITLDSDVISQNPNFHLIDSVNPK